MNHKSQLLLWLLIVFSFSCFGVETGKLSILNPSLGHKVIEYQIIQNYALAEGDIILDTIANLNKPQAMIRTKLNGSRWHEALIPFKIDENLPWENKLAVLEAISHWQKNTQLKFIEVNEKNRQEFPDYIHFIPASGTTCASYVGRIGGEQEILLAPRCTAMNTVHEIGHALGLWHEQSRIDRDNYIRILWGNIEEDHRFNFEQQLNNGEDFAEYDYQSIMHYGPYAFSKNGEKTILPLQDGVEIGQREGLSPKDIAAVMAMYAP